jgi:serine protease Do
MKKFFFLLAILVSVTLVAQQSVLSPVQIAERNKPGTVMIKATYKGTVTIYQPVTDVESVKVLAARIRQKLADEGRGEDEFWNVFLMTYCKTIDQYLLKGTETISKDLDITMVGSGFIVTPDGYVITNAHVVDENDEETKRSFVEQAFQEILEKDASDVEETMGRKLTEEESKALIEANSWYFSQTLEVSDIEKEFSVVVGVTGNKGKIVPKVIPAKIVTHGSPIPGKDVAILKMAEKHKYPTIRIGDDKEMQVGSQVYVLGYPAVATFNPLLSLETVSEATLTRGLVSAKKNMKDGWEVLQIDAAITHGNSGGPVMNEKGEVIGLATFVSVDEQEVQGMNFLVPTTIVNEFLDKARIKPEMSDISLAYEEAMNFFDKSRYKKALVKFNVVKDMNVSFPFISKYISDTQRNIDKGLDKEPGNMMMYYFIGGGAVVLVLVFILGRRSRKKIA